MDIDSIPSKFGGEFLSLDGALYWVNLLESPDLKLFEFRGRVAILAPCVRSYHFVLQVLKWTMKVIPGAGMFPLSPKVWRFFCK